jgi:hypothetical protein
MVVYCLYHIKALASKHYAQLQKLLKEGTRSIQRKRPTDPTNTEKFNTYKFADYKEHVIDLLKRVCTVSVETMQIVAQMPE